MRPGDDPLPVGKIHSLATNALAALEAPALPTARCSASGCRSWLILEREKTRGTCDDCASGGLRRVRDDGLLERIPVKFRWASFDKPMIPPGAATEIVTEDQRMGALLWLASDVQVLMVAGVELPNGTTPTGVGKSSLAAALARAAVGEHWRIHWVRAAELGPMYPDRHRTIIDMVEAAGRSIVIVDGLGKELALAKVDSGVLTQRVPAMQELIALVYERPKTRFIFTSDITGKLMDDAYGSDAVRRIAKKPNAALIMLGDGK